MEDIIRINVGPLTAMPHLILDNTLPPGLAVSEPPSLSYFPNFVEDLSVDEHADTLMRWNPALQIETDRMLLASSSGERYYNERVILLPDRILAFLWQALNGGFPDVVWINDKCRGVFILADAIDRADLAWRAPLMNMYHRVDKECGKRTYFGYSHDTAELASVRRGHAGKGG